MNSEGTQAYIFMYPFSSKLPSHPGCAGHISTHNTTPSPGQPPLFTGPGGTQWVSLGGPEATGWSDCPTLFPLCAQCLSALIPTPQLAGSPCRTTSPASPTTATGCRWRTRSASHRRPACWAPASCRRAHMPGRWTWGRWPAGAWG